MQQTKQQVIASPAR